MTNGKKECIYEDLLQPGYWLIANNDVERDE